MVSAPVRKRGVVPSGNRWKARAKKGGVQVHLGVFDTIEKAAEAVKHFDETGEKPPRSRTRAWSGHRGVTIKGKKFQAEIRKDGKKHFLGTFDDIKAASQAVIHFEATGEKPISLRGRKLPASGFEGVVRNGNSWTAHARKACD